METNPNSDPARAIRNLEAAKATLIEQGWHQYSMGNYAQKTGSVCAVGAMLRAANYQFGDVIEVPGINDLQSAVQATNKVIGCGLPHCTCEITGWNDAEGRTVNEVLGLFDDAILLAKESLTTE